jgi:hypothetical protein
MVDLPLFLMKRLFSGLIPALVFLGAIESRAAIQIGVTSQ